nr:putative esterase [uncultured bacterium]
MRWLLKPLLSLFSLLPRFFAYRTQLFLAGGLRSKAAGQAVDYTSVGGVPCITVGAAMADTGAKESKVVLYLHGGAFIMPPMPAAHVGFLARLSRDLGATGLLPDYRLAPMHKYPAALDDCEKAYRGLLAAGYSGKRILLAGESAGGNLVLGLLQRIRRHGLEMPISAVAISPVAEVARVHSPPSRCDKAKVDAMLPVKSFSKMLEYYAGGVDGSDPELSPMLADFTGFPPLYFIVGEDEVLLDDSLICARLAKQAGVETKLDVWPALPHAFPLLEGRFPEAREARSDIVAFFNEQLAKPPATGTTAGKPARRRKTTAKRAVKTTNTSRAKNTVSKKSAVKKKAPNKAP